MFCHGKNWKHSCNLLHTLARRQTMTFTCTCLALSGIFLAGCTSFRSRWISNILLVSSNIYYSYLIMASQLIDPSQTKWPSHRISIFLTSFIQDSGSGLDAFATHLAWSKLRDFPCSCQMRARTSHMPTNAAWGYIESCGKVTLHSRISQGLSPSQSPVTC